MKLWPKKKTKQDAYSEKIRLRNEKREAKEKAIEDEQKRLEKEQEEKDQQEFDNWKDLFTVETKGTVKDDMAGEGGLLNEFIDFIKKNKVTPLEDIAIKFNLRTKDVVTRIKTLEKSERLSGLFDDRGKFIYITTEEMDAVAKFINEKGRVTIDELVLESNKLINMEQQDDIDLEEQNEEEEDIETNNEDDAAL